MGRFIRGRGQEVWHGKEGLVMEQQWIYVENYQAEAKTAKV